jgi:hypothetical protein
MYEKSKKLFLKEKKVKEENTQVIFEITLSNLSAEGKINERDFLDRAELLCSLGQNVMITNFQQYFKLVEYFSEFTKERMGIAMGVYNLIQIFDEKYYRNLSGGILEAFGKLFYRDLKVYMYPYHDQASDTLINSENLKVHPRVKELYKFFKNNGKLVNIDDFDPEILDIFSRTVLKMIRDGENGWEAMLPKGIPEIIKQKRLFGYSKARENK